MKKIVAVLTALLLTAVFVCPVCVLAEGEPAFEVSSVSAKRGEGAEVTISVKNNPGITSAKLLVNFDSEMTLKKVEYGEDFASNAMQPQKDKMSESPVTLNWVLGLSDFKGDGVFATLTFAADSKAKAGDHKISVTYNENDVFNLKEENVKFSTVDGVFTVKGDPEEVITGDTAEPVTTIGAESVTGDDGEGNFIGEEEVFDEDEDDAGADDSAACKNNWVIWLAVCAAVLVVAAVVVTAVVKKKGKKETDKQE